MANGARPVSSPANLRKRARRTPKSVPISLIEEQCAHAIKCMEGFPPGSYPRTYWSHAAVALGDLLAVARGMRVCILFPTTDISKAPRKRARRKAEQP